MKIFKQSILVVALAAFCLGATCNTSQQRTTFNSIASVENGVDSAYKAYLDLVIQGKVKTNSVPSISLKYDLFQMTVRDAILVSTTTKTSAPPANVTQRATDILTSINAAEKGK